MKSYKHVWYINFKLLTKFHTFWTEIIGYMDLGPNPNRFIYIDLVYIFSDLYIFKIKPRIIKCGK